MDAKPNSILVLEDDASQLATLKVLLEDEGLDVTGCSRGTEALQLLRSNGFAVAIIDLSLPDISQQQLLDELAPLSSHIPLIINTGRGSYESAKTSANLGVFAFVEKMGDPKELLLKVHKAVHAQAERLASRALERERERAQIYFEMAGVIMVAIDKRKKVTSVNKKGAEFLGLDQEHIIGLDWFETFIPEHDRRRVISGFEDLMAGRIELAEYFENPVITVDGRERLVAWHNVLLYDDEGSIVGTLSSGQDITDLRKAEQERERSRRFLESVMDAYPGNVAVLDDAGRIVVVNEGWSRFGRENGLGQQYAETGVDYLDLCDRAEGPWSEEAPTVAGHLRRMLAGEDIDFEIEYPCHSPDVRRWFQIQARPFEHEGQRWIVMAHIDITARIEAQEVLRDREQRLRLAMESANECSWELDVPSDRVDFRETAVELLGYEPGEVQDTNAWWKEQLHPDDRQRVERVVGDYLEGRTADYSCKFRLRHRDGQYIWIASNGRITQRDEKGEPVRMVGIHRDITAQRRTEEDVRSIFELSPDLICIADLRQGRFVRVNPAFEMTLGYSEQELLSTPFADLIHPDDVRATRSLMERMLRQGKTVINYENRYRCKDGSYRWLSWNSETRPQEGLCYAVAHDVTEQKMAQKRQNQHMRDLEFLSQATAGFLPLQTKEELASHAAEKLRAIAGNSIVVVNEYDAASRCLTARRVLGLGGHTEAIIRILGRHPEGRSFELDDEAVQELSTGELKRVPNGLYDLSPDIPQSACKAIEKLLGIKHVYAMGLISGDRMAGSIAILMRDGADLENKALIELFGREAAVALQRAEAEESLSWSEERYRVTIDSIQEGLYDWDIQNNTVFFSDSYWRILGYEPGELPAAFDTYVQLLHPDDREAAERDLPQFLGGGNDVVEVDQRFRTKSGRYIWVRSTGSVVRRDEDGKPLRMVGTVTNIDARRRAEDALREREYILNETGLTARIGGWRHDLTTGGAKWTKALYDIIEINESEEPPGVDEHLDYYPPEDRAILQETYRLAVERGIRFDLELQVNTATGKRLWARVIGKPIMAEGNCIAIQGTFQDISDRKQAELELEEQLRFIRRLMDTLPNPVFYKDTDGRYMGCNTAFAKFIGRSLDEIEGKTVSDVSPQELAEEYRRRDMELLERGGFQEYESKVRRSDDSTRDVIFTKATFENAQGDIAGIIGMISDITEHKRAEEGLARERRRFKQILDCFPYGIYIADRDQNVEYVNSYLLRVFGEPGELKCHEYFHHLPEPCPWCQNKKVFQGETVNWNWHSPRNNQDYEVVDIPLHNDDGTVSKLEVFQDVTDRKRAQEAVQRNRRQLRSLAARLSLVEERERRRIALWLHDEIAQRLAVSQIELQDLRRSQTGASEYEKIDRLSGEIDELMKEIRSETFELGTPTLYLVGLEAGVESWLKRVVGEKYGLRTSFSAQGDFSDLDKDLVLVLFRSTRELLANVVKHARAEKVEVGLRRNRDQVQIEVRDDGVGFDPAAVLSVDDEVDSQSFGLVSVREQAEHLGGRMSLESGENKGTCITLTIPIKSQDNKD